MSEENKSPEVIHVVTKDTKSAGVAIVLSFFYPGLGQLYAGKIARGLVMMLVVNPLIGVIAFCGGCSGSAVVPATIASIFDPSASEVSGGPGTAGFGAVAVIGMVLAIGLPLGFWIWNMVDAKKQCESHNQALSNT